MPDLILSAILSVRNRFLEYLIGFGRVEDAMNFMTETLILMEQNKLNCPCVYEVKLTQKPLFDMVEKEHKALKLKEAR